MTKTRTFAVSCLSAILGRNGRPKELIDHFSQSLDRRDRAFLMEIVYGVLRNLYVLDEIAGSYLRDTRKLGDSTLNNLRIALYQILFMRVAGYAVVNEAVEIEKKGGKPSLVNAVLRNVLRGRETIILPLRRDNAEDDISINTSHPKWMVRRWIERFGADEAGLLAAANNSIPPLVLRTNRLRTSREELLEKLVAREIWAEATHFSPDGIVVGDASSYQDLPVSEGLFGVQDEASQLISCLLNPAEGERILDACAAPGGKTIHLAQLMGDRGEIVAVEKDPKRMQKLSAAVSSLGLKSVRLLTTDAAALRGEGEFDRILLDAPCSSIGVIRRNPDVKYRHRPGSLSGFGKKQRELLRSIAPLLRKGGRLVYSVCSIEPEEGEAVIADFLKTAGEFRIIEPDQEFLKPLSDGGFFRSYPHKNNMDGFFGAILCRKA